MDPSPKAPAAARDEAAAASAAAEEQLTRALESLDGAAREALRAEVAQASLESGFTWERPAGGYDPVPLMLRPRVWTRSQAATVQRACLALRDGIARLLPAWLEDPAVRALLPVTDYEGEQVRTLARAGPPLHDAFLFARLDALVDCTAPDWERTLAFLEPNVVGVGGTRYTALGERVWNAVVRPRLAAPPLLPPLDSRLLLRDALVDRARALGLAEPVRVAMVEDLRETFGTNELRYIAAHLTVQGTPTHHVDVRALEWRGAQLYADGHPVDLVYRFPELRELEELDDGRCLAPLWRAFAENRVVSTLGGDFDHKSTFELFTSPRFERLFTPEQRQLFARHVLWTRLVTPRRTEGPDGKELDLVPFVRAGQQELVLKPNRSYGGQGVTIGPEVTVQAWGARIEEALANPGAWVVQAYRPLPRQPFPVFEDGACRREELAMVSGFYATHRGVTSMGRVARQSVVNLSQRGSSLVPQVTIEG